MSTAGVTEEEFQTAQHHTIHKNAKHMAVFIGRGRGKDFVPDYKFGAQIGQCSSQIPRPCYTK